MIDLHHHLLPGLDDGSPDMDTSVRMARMASEDGITHVVCTPHANNQFDYDPFRVEDLLNELRARLAAERIDLQLLRGADFHLTFDNIRAAIADPARFSIAGRGYIMTELPDHGAFSSFGQTYYELQLANLTPVLTHPERNQTLQSDRSRLEDWLRQGVLMQVTAGSLLGSMGRTAQKIALEMLDRQWIHFIATDAHNLSRRPPVLRAAYDEVARRTDQATAERLFVSNPLAAIEGRPFPPQPQPAGLYNDDDGLDPLPAQNWWQRIFGR